MPRPPKRQTITVHGWVGDYWLAQRDELARLVPEEPEYRHRDRYTLRWGLIADTATEVLRAARAQVGEDWSPLLAATWNVEVTVETPEPLRKWEAWVVGSLFWDHAATDWWTDEVTNGRHRIWGVAQSDAVCIPLQSRVVSDWAHGLFGDPDCTTLRIQTWSCAYLYKFVGACEQWRDRPGADVEFVDGLEFAVEVADDFLDAVAEAAGDSPVTLTAT